MSRTINEPSNDRPSDTSPRERSSRCRWTTSLRLASGSAAVTTLILLTGLVGCGTNWQDVLAQTGTAIGQTYVDLFLTDVANAVADRFDDEGTDDGQGDGADDTDGEDGNGTDQDGGDDDSGGDLSGLTGDPAAGQTLYASCAGCHCADAVGGCLPTAPGLIGASAELNDEYLRGDATHPTKPDLSDQEIVDLAAYLASLAEQ